MIYRINYSRVIAQAKMIDDCADELHQQISRLNNIEQECLAAWKSPAADVFLSKIREMRNQMQRTKNQVAALAETIRVCANRIKREDEEAARRAAQLSSGR